MLGYDWPRLHAALNDLPAALLLVAVIFDIMAALTKRPALRLAGYWMMIAGAVGGVLAVLSGLQAEDHIAHGEAVHEAMEKHETLALVTLGIFAVLAIWRILRENKMGSGERNLSLLVSLGGAWRPSGDRVAGRQARLRSRGRDTNAGPAERNTRAGRGPSSPRRGGGRGT